MRTNARALGIFAALCGFLAVFIFRRGLSAEYAFFFSAAGTPDPLSGAGANIVAWFTLFRDRPLIAFIVFNFFDAVNALLVSFLLLPYLCALFNKNRLLGVPLLAADFLSPLLFFWSNRSAALYFLSRQYFRSHHFEEKLPYMDAGREVLRHLVEANSAVNLVGNAALALLLVTGLSLALFRVGKSRKDWPGVVGNALALVYFPLLALAPRYASVATALSAPFLVVWYFLLAVSSARGVYVNNQ